jgi:dihydrofolate synthase/folylpolyglutamate synthase
MGKPGTERGRASAAAGDHLAWLDARIDYERTPPRGSPRAAFGLARMRSLLAAIGNPHHDVPAVHVAGTKGKGSTVAMLAAILEEAGYRTGRYLSPHVHGVEERIAVAGLPISPVDFAAACEVVRPAVERLDRAAAGRTAAGPTWFEIVTALAFTHFARSQVEFAVLETGLGGRLDATNVCRPLVTVITSISFDHMGLLGRTIRSITGEKAGIIKRGCPVISGVSQHSARRVIADTARRRRARLLQLGRDFSLAHEPAAPAATLAPGDVIVTPREGGGHRYSLGMIGSHQAANAALAVMAARELAARGFSISEAAIARGLAGTRLPARIEVIGRRPLVVADAAHNVASLESLLDTVGPAIAGRRPRVLLFAASRDKQIEEMLDAAGGLFEHVVLTRYTTNPRAASIERLEAACQRAGLPKPRIAATPAAGLADARKLAGPTGSVIVAGSFFLAAEVRTGGRG